MTSSQPLRSLLVVVALMGFLSGCSDGAQREVSELRTRIDGLAAKLHALTEDKAKADAELIKRQAELVAAWEPRARNHFRQRSLLSATQLC